MPIKRRVSKLREPLDADHEAWLKGARSYCEFFDGEDKLAEHWREHGERIVAEWVSEFPGTRPDRWWQYSAPRGPDGKLKRPFGWPELRRRLGGIGNLKSDVLAHVESSWCGMPTCWLMRSDVLLYTTGKFEELRRRRGDKPFCGVALDPRDPPQFESEASYLKRHRLFLRGEAARLTVDDFEPEKAFAE